MVEIGDEVVHQSHPGRFTVIAKEASPGLNVYSDIITVRSNDGIELRLLETSVRVLEAPPAKAAAESAAQAPASPASSTPPAGAGGSESRAPATPAGKGESAR